MTNRDLQALIDLAGFVKSTAGSRSPNSKATLITGGGICAQLQMPTNAEFVGKATRGKKGNSVAVYEANPPGRGL